MKYIYVRHSVNFFAEHPANMQLIRNIHSRRPRHSQMISHWKSKFHLIAHSLSSQPKLSFKLFALALMRSCLKMQSKLMKTHNSQMNNIRF